MDGIYHDTNIEDSDGAEPPAKDSNPSLPSDDHSNFLEDPINTSLEPEEKVRLFAQMVRIRRFEERSLRAYQQGHIGGFLHLYIGQEAVAVGSVSVMTEDDHVITP